ncbi:hypothetical protein LTR78_001202 [Recurvomyces mirabilis]|uniref:Uncharacterized protein n=1 Tax=Recurvomyces mirabilis TaxID=574656 RepID=A0AAE1C5D3_9PEZI|nr:hypothetical protein LTR78_001202 [Recurvomyces mirabilis]KAK5161178.1 hypothetical protein LTS14_000974 [Recurvomyces mirabilis]
MAAQTLNRYGTAQQIGRKANRLSYDYKDLTKSDLDCVADILVASPAEATAATLFEEATSAMIARLPKNLRCKHSWLSTFCAKHRKLNPLPIISLWRIVRHTVVDELRKTLSPLTQTGQVPPEKALFADALRSHDWHNTGCEACSIVSMAEKVALVIAVAAIHLTILSPANWRKSKRVYFLERLLQGRHSSGNDDHSVVKIYTAIRTAVQNPANPGSLSAHYSDALPSGTSSGAPITSSRPLHDPPWAATAFSTYENGNMASTVPLESAPVNDNEEEEGVCMTDNTDDLFADPIPGTESLETGSIMIGNEVQDLFEDEPASAAVDSIWRFRPVSRASQRLDNIWLPQSKYVGAAPALKRERSLCPVLRVGKNGEVKGPFDPASKSYTRRHL